MGLLSALGRGARSFGKHYTNTAGAGMGLGALLGGGLGVYDQATDGVEGMQADPILNSALSGAMLGAIPGGVAGIGRGAVGAARAMRLDPQLIHRAEQALRRSGVSEARLRNMADDDKVLHAFGIR